MPPDTPNKIRSKNPRAGLYVRVSTDEQDVGMQVDDLEQLADQRGWEVVDTYRDEGVSGATTSRPALDRMLDDARTGKLDLIAVWKLDRLGRTLRGLVSLVDDLGRWGVDLVSVHDRDIDTTSPSGLLIFQIFAAVAEYERGIIRERSLAGIRRAQRDGKHCGRKPKEIDLRPAIALLDQDRTLTEVAGILALDRTTLRRRLIAAGEWPRMPPGVVEGEGMEMPE